MIFILADTRTVSGHAPSATQDKTSANQPTQTPPQRQEVWDPRRDDSLGDTRTVSGHAPSATQIQSLSQPDYIKEEEEGKEAGEKGRREKGEERRELDSYHFVFLFFIFYVNFM